PISGHAVGRPLPCSAGVRELVPLLRPDRRRGKGRVRALAGVLLKQPQPSLICPPVRLTLPSGCRARTADLNGTTADDSDQYTHDARGLGAHRRVRALTRLRALSRDVEGRDRKSVV